jgi:hypothetical protein
VPENLAKSQQSKNILVTVPPECALRKGLAQLVVGTGSYTP